MTDLTPVEKFVLEQIAETGKARMTITLAVEGLERFAGVGTAEIDNDQPTEVGKMLAVKAVTDATLQFYKNLDDIKDEA